MGRQSQHDTFSVPRRRRRDKRVSFGSAYPYARRSALLSQGELAFFRTLQAAVEPWQWISLKMRLADVVQCPTYLWDRAPGRRLSQKHIDFVLYDYNSTRIVAAIELDDASHQQPHRRARDRFVDATMRVAKTPLIRIRAARYYDVSALRELLQKAVSKR